MNKIACAALLMAVSLKAQTGPAAQDTAPAKSEVPSQDQPQTPAASSLVQEHPLKPETLKRLLDLGYFNPAQPRVATVTPAECAIPLLAFPVPDKERLSGKTIPANPSIDPKIISAPPLPACPQKAAPSTTRPLAPAPQKK